MVKEMARVHIDTLGVSELKWTGMGEFNSDDHYVYYRGQDSRRRNGVALRASKEPGMQCLGAVSMMIGGAQFIFKANVQHHGNPSLCPNHWCRRRPKRPYRTKTKKRCPFHHKGLKCKSRKSRDSWCNRQVWPWSTKWSRAKANRVLPRE